LNAVWIVAAFVFDQEAVQRMPFRAHNIAGRYPRGISCLSIAVLSRPRCATT
jgi:hypothetical protein